MWPFPDEQAFRAWAADPDAWLSEQDEDLMLHDPAGLPLLLSAAQDPDCPKKDYCVDVLADYARRIVGWDKVDVYQALRETATTAAASHDSRARQWSEYVTRLFSYRAKARPVNRAGAEQMAADLLLGPADRLVVQVAPGGKHWQCAEPDAYPTYLYINRRTGSFRLVRFQPLSTAELAALPS
ncbi:hypothetical protein [Kibdelosporangium aridum]|uniref:hypothetical protein n=1 Tax=Kibdelosporangium aridum TaxID=2030 RepID=UPI00052427B1